MPHTARLTYEDCDENPIEVLVAYTCTRGHPAYTPLGEYAPTEPPESPEVDVTTIKVLARDSNGQLKTPMWEAPNHELFVTLHAWLYEDNNYEYLVNEAETDNREWEDGL